MGRAEAGDAAVERLSRLHALTEAALAHLGLDELLSELLVRVRALLDADTAAVLLLDPEGNELVARAAHGIEEEVEQGVRIPLGRGFAGRVAESRAPVVIPDVDHADVLNPILREKGIRSLLGVPLLVEGDVIGVVHVGTLSARDFNDGDSALLQLAADRMALAIAHARLYEAERAARAAAERTADHLHRIQSITDVALGHFSLDEELLNRLLERVRDVLGVDTAAILLLDTERGELVARAAKGIEEEVEQGVRIPLGRGFAGRVAESRAPVVIPDLDQADIYNPILREKHIRSMLGVPLLIEGRVLGVLHIGTLVPRLFGSDDIALLELAADRIAIAIDRARQYGVARVLQRSLLPSRLPPLPGVSMAARYLPAAEDADVGGDWYDVIALPHGRVGIAMGDVVSRGVRAAAGMGALRTTLRAYAVDGAPPDEVLDRVNSLARAGDEREMATIAYIVLEPDTGELTFTLAAHPPPLVVGDDGAARYLEGGRGAPISAAAPTRYERAHARLEPGETLVLYTDGLVERKSEALDVGLDRLLRAAAGTPRAPDALCEHLVGELGGASDDVAILAVRLAGAPAGPLELTVRAVPGSLSTMRRALTSWLEAAGMDADSAYDVVLAVGEAAANAVEHAYGPVERAFELTAEVADGSACVRIADEGRWRAPRGANRGRGIGLMRELMDEVEIEAGDAGTVVTMRRRLTGTEVT